MKRYQECNKLQKFWRCRWYIIVPFIVFWHKVVGTKVYEEEFNEKEKCIEPTGNSELLSWFLCWRVALGDAQSKMKYYYTTDEVFEKIKEKTNRIDK